MNVLEKILEEIKEATYQEDAPLYLGDVEVDGYIRESKVKEIIRSHMNEAENDGWIRTSERIPNEEEFIKAYCRNAYAAEFIVMIKGATLPTTLYFKNGSWTDMKGNYYNVVAWQPLPEPYRAADNKPDWKEHMLNTFLAGH